MVYSIIVKKLNRKNSSFFESDTKAKSVKSETIVYKKITHNLLSLFLLKKTRNKIMGNNPENTLIILSISFSNKMP